MGAYFSGPLADKLGRRKPMIVSLVFMIALNMISALSPNVLFYGIIRFGMGFCAGFYSPIGFTYVLEMMPPSIRGKVITIGSAMLFLG